jgi:hypothetical protein
MACKPCHGFHFYSIRTGSVPVPFWTVKAASSNSLFSLVNSASAFSEGIFSSSADQQVNMMSGYLLPLTWKNPYMLAWRRL